MKKKLMALLLAVAVVGMYSFGSVASVFAETTDGSETAGETAASTVNVTFDNNGGTGDAPATVASASGKTITLPDNTGTKSGYVFIGWSTDKDANASGSSHYSQTVYAAGAKFTVKDSNTTLYAIWSSSSTTDAQFFIRLDGQIPTEPQSHASSQYTSAINIKGAIAAGKSYFYTNSTSGVAKQLTTTPTDAQIKAVYPDYNSSTQYVLWYVVKYESTWHIDGVLLDKAKVNLSYSPNAAAGTWSNMPDGQQYAVGETATVSSTTPTREGYTFNGWNTKPSGSGTSYSAGDTFTIDADTTLYAQWVANSGTEYKVEHMVPDSNSKTGYKVAETQTLKAETGSEVTAEPVDDTGYAYDEATTATRGENKGIVAGGGDLVLRVYYKAKTAITITAGSATQDYNGNALTCGNYEVSGSLNAGDEIRGITITGLQIEVGSSANVISAVTIMNGTKDVTYDYTITFAPGLLTVNLVAATTPDDPIVIPVPSVNTTTYKVVANYYTSTDGGAYVQDNSSVVTLKDATSVNVGDTISAADFSGSNSYNGNSYGLDESKSTMSAVAVLDADSNVLTLNYYRSTNGGSSNDPSNNNSNGNNSNNGSSSNTADNNNSNGNSSSSGSASATASNMNANVPDTGDTSDAALWTSIGLTSLVLAGAMISLRRKEEK